MNFHATVNKKIYINKWFANADKNVQQPGCMFKTQ